MNIFISFNVKVYTSFIMSSQNLLTDRPRPKPSNLNIRYLIEGELKTSRFTGYSSDSFEVMKSKIQKANKSGILKNVNSKDLTLYAVSDVSRQWPG